ncbi:MAG: MFS transporter [Alphaproteobacteria bacterium]
MKRTTWRGPTVVLLCGAGVLAIAMGTRQTFGLFLEPMTQDLGISRGNFALAIAVQNLIWGLLTPFFGLFADRYGTARCLTFGGIVYVCGLLIMALGNDAFALHLGGGVLVGIAVAACGFPLVLSAVARAVPPERRSAALGVASAGGSVGQFLMLPLTQLTMGWLGWAGALLVLVAVSAFIVPLSVGLAGKPNKIAAGQHTLGRAVTQARRHRGYQLLNAGFFVCGFHVAFIATHFPAYINTFGLDPLVGASALGVIGFFNIIGGLLAGYLGGRYRKKYLLSGLYLVRAIAIVLFMMAPKTEIAIWLFAATFGITWLSTVPLTSGLVGDVFGPRYLATLFGFVMLSHQLGAFLGAWLGGLSYDLTGSYDAVWALAVVLGLLAAALHWPIADKPVAVETEAGGH